MKNFIYRKRKLLAAGALAALDLTTLRTLLLTVLIVGSSLACSTPRPTPDIPATVVALVEMELQTVAPTSTSLPTAIPNPASTATPVPTPTQVPTPTPVPTATHLFSVLTDRVISVGEMKSLRGHKGAFWRDGETFVLRGCATGVVINFDSSQWAVFSHDGEFSKDSFFVLVGRYWKVVEGDCYEMVVARVWDDSLCYFKSFLPRPFFGCENGWVQKTDFFEMEGDSVIARKSLMRRWWRH